MFNAAKEEESKYLEQVVKALAKECNALTERINQDKESIFETKKYMHESVYEMDPTEVRANRQILESMVDAAYNLHNRKRRYERMINAPYFGRIDFVYDNREKAKKIEKGFIVSDGNIFNIYIGINSYIKGSQNVIFDWRSPISSMFYDYETGKAKYYAPEGEISGNISYKRQYKIEQGMLKYMIESSITIDDDVLQEQLSKATSDKMKNIVATIQKEQNSIIRDENSDVLIIQGVAGSGKTSIALHRVAYLLYRLKDKIYSENMMIISPNKVFSDYISNVLPELGEEQILQMTFEDITDHELMDICEYQTLYQQISEMLENYDEFLAERIKFKSSLDFLDKMNEYITYVTETNFVPETFYYEHDERQLEIPEYYLRDRYNAYVRFPMRKRIDTILEDVIEKIIDYYNIKKTKIRVIQVRNKLYGMMKEKELLKLYENFYKFINAKKMFAGNIKEKIPYDDVAPLLYMKSTLYGTDSFLYLKHLLIDEMQDYSPVHYAFFNKIFPCRKTILGDVRQLVNPFNENSSQDDIAELYGRIPKLKINTMQLYKSYRSTTEITEFARKIIDNDKIEVIERHGEEPEVIKCSDKNEEVKKISEQIEKNIQNGYKSTGIICKTEKQAEALFKSLKKINEKLNTELALITSFSTEFTNKLIVTSAYLAKGLEFDCVILPDTDEKNYANETDRQMVYIGVTRALHRLTLLYCGEKSKFLRG